MLLEDKNAVIYRGGSAIGGSVARACARERARVFLAGRTVTLLDEQAIEKHADAVAEKARSIDISFNAIGMGDVQGTPLSEMALQDFALLVMTWTSNLPLDTIYVDGHTEEIEGRR